MTERVAITPDGQEHRFPEGTPDAVIDAAIQEYLGVTASEDRSQWGPMETINNVINQLGTGAYKAVAGVAGMPGDVAAAGQNAPMPKVTGNPKIDQLRAGVETNRRAAGNIIPTGQEIIAGAEKYVPGFKMAPAETRGDKLLQAGGAGATGVFFPGGALPSFVGGVGGGVASEAAGQLTEGTAAEPYARIIAGLAGGVGGSMLTNRMAASNVEQLINKATTGATPDDWAAAMRLQSDAAARGTPITSAEALSQVMGGNRTLQSVQRTVEQMPDASATMDNFMSSRPAGNQAAVASQLDEMSSMPDAPFEVGPTVQKAAQQSIEGVRQQINAITDDAYRWGTDQLIPPAEFAPISENPIFQHFAAQVRKDPILGPAIANLDENSVAFVNAVKKEMDEAAEGFSSFTSQTKSPERAMRVEQAQKPMVTAARDASPLYDEALTEQARLRQSKLEPMKRGITGQLANADDWKAQARIILSDTPGAEKEVAAAVKAISAQTPEAIPELLRMKIQNLYDDALQATKGTNEQTRGSRFAGKLIADQQGIKSLEAAVKALPNGETQWAGFRRLLDVFEAQSYRLDPGSPTSFNQQLAGDLQRNIGKGVKSFGTDLWANWNVQRRSQELARILTAPEGVALLRQLAVTGPNTARAQQLVQGFYQGAQGARSSEPVIDIRRAGATPPLQQAPQ